jgi:hypothetical protein
VAAKAALAQNGHIYDLPAMEHPTTELPVEGGTDYVDGEWEGTMQLEQRE